MTLQETLHALSQVAGGWIHFWEAHNGYVTLSVKSCEPDEAYRIHQVVATKNKPFNPDFNTMQILFGAICEKVEAEGWDWASHRFKGGLDEQAEYYFGINPMGSTEDGGIESGVSKDHPAHAAAQALLAALQTKEESE